MKVPGSVYQCFYCGEQVNSKAQIKSHEFECTAKKTGRAITQAARSMQKMAKAIAQPVNDSARLAAIRELL